MAGVIDAEYRGPVGVRLANLSDADFEIKVGDRIAQLIVEKVCVTMYSWGLGCVCCGDSANMEQIVMPEVVVVQKLEESVRGAGGFGSTGGFGAGQAA